MKDYKKVSISEAKVYEENSLCACTLTKLLIISISIIIIITVVLILIFYHDNSDDKIYIEVKNNNKNIIRGTSDYNEIKSFENKLRQITKSEMAEFRQINNLGILYDTTKYPRSENPDVSIITTLYNQAHCIHKAIRSVQNQSLKNVEMIIIDDCSRDNSTETVESYMKEDDRIILIKKEMNEGIMITRNKGIRQAKGRYICILDADDTLAHKDILKYALHIADLGNLDVVEFFTAYFNFNVFQGYYHYHGKDLGIIYQPELKTKFYEFKDKESFRAIKC
jgi:cellulose synthase/poly-beta-1,6-N-acetylglucosamine synthase-like glycosyltransferase